MIVVWRWVNVYRPRQLTGSPKARLLGIMINAVIFSRAALA